MDLLFTDMNRNVPRYEEKLIEGQLWVGLNCSLDSIPAQAMALKDQIERGKNAQTGPTGVFLDLDPAIEMDWDDLNFPWRFHIPVGSMPAVETPWEHQMYQTSPWVMRDNEYQLTEDFKDKAANDLQEAWLAVAELSSKDPVPPMTPCPSEFSIFQLEFSSPSLADIQIIGAEAKRAALDYKGFLNWVTSAFEGWEEGSSEETLNYIAGLDLGSRKVRGGLIDLARDWRHINLEQWVRRGVPIAYPWTISCEEERFRRLSPRVLKEYWRAVDAAGGRQLSVYQIPALADQRVALERFDSFLQEKNDNYVPAEAPFQLDSRWSFAIIDFEGWKRRAGIPFSTAKRYANQFHHDLFSIGDGVSSMVVFWRWRPKFLPDDLEAATLEEDLFSIRERYCGTHAPLPGQIFDRESGMEIRAPFEGPDALERLTKELKDGIMHHRRPLLERMQSPDRNPASRSVEDQHHPPRGRKAGRGKSKNRRGGPTVWELNRIHQGPSTESRLGRSTDNNSYQGASSGRSGSSVYKTSSERSASPSTRSLLSYEDREKVRERYLQSVAAFGERLTYQGSLYFMPIGAKWGEEVLKRGHLIIGDLDVQVRLRYWAACTKGILNLKHLLDRAVQHGLKFHIGIRHADKGYFRPIRVSQTDKLLTYRLYQPGYRDDPIVEGQGGKSFRDYYLGRLGDITRRPHARAMIGEGGPMRWIAIKYGGDDLVEAFMSGPSIQVTVHNRGHTASDGDDASQLQWDEMSPYEEDIIFGHLAAAGGQPERWLWPTEELLDRYCLHWSGEWNLGVDRLFGILDGELQRGTQKLRCRKEWMEFLRKGHRGENEPDDVLEQKDFEEVRDKLAAAFPVNWHNKRLSDIVLPERFHLPTMERRGGM